MQDLISLAINNPRKHPEFIITEDVENVEASISRENDKMEELATTFYKQVTADTAKMMQDFQSRLFEILGVNTGTCGINDDPNKIFPWNDKSFWSKADDRLITSAFNGKLKLTDNQKTWLKIIPTEDPKSPRFACKICQDHLRRNPHLSDSKFGHMARQQGAFYDETISSVEKHLYWRSKFASHEQPHAKGGTQMRNHARIILEMKKAMLEQSNTCFKNAQGNIDQNKIYTSRVFLTAYTVVKKNISLRLYPPLIKLLQASGSLPSAIRHGNRRSLGRIVNVIARNMRQRLIETIKTHRPPITIILDTSSDKQCRQYLIVFLQMAIDITPKVYLYKVIELKDGERAVNMKDGLLKAFDEDSMTKIIKESLIAFSSDGAANMAGIRGGLEKLLLGGVQQYANTLQPLIERFGGADQQIIFQCVQVLNYLFQNDQDNYRNNQAMTMPQFWQYALTVANKKGHVHIDELKIFLFFIVKIIVST